MKTGKAESGLPAGEISGLRTAIENLYIQYCGAVARDLIPGIRGEWLSQFQPRLATLKKYVDMLAATIPEKDVQTAFKTEAGRKMINRNT